MVDSIMVTLLGEHGQELFDAELPCNIIIADLKIQLTDIFEISHGKKKTRLFYDGKELADNTSLSENDVWDGSFIIVKAGE